MQERTTHNFLFGIGYGDPQLSNIPSSVHIRVGDIATAWTNERRALPDADHLASVAYLAGVTWVNDYKGDSGETRLVFKERTKLKERPRIMPSSLLLSDGRSFPDPLQVFHGNAHAKGYSLGDNALADGVIGQARESCFPALKPFQAFLAAGRAFALKRASRLKILVSYPVKLFRAVLCSIGK